MVCFPAAGRPAPVLVAVRRLGAAVPLRSQRVVPLSHHCGEVERSTGEGGEWRPAGPDGSPHTVGRLKEDEADQRLLLEPREPLSCAGKSRKLLPALRRLRRAEGEPASRS